MRVLALDPGQRVGWARADVDPATGEWTNLEHGITPLKEMALAVHDALVEPPFPLADGYDLVICESWRLTADKADAMIGNEFLSSQFIGMVRLCCWLSGTKFCLQAPRRKYDAAKSLPNCSEQPLIERILDLPHDDAHDGDALLHLWYYTFKHTNIGA